MTKTPLSCLAGSLSGSFTSSDLRRNAGFNSAFASAFASAGTGDGGAGSGALVNGSEVVDSASCGKGLASTLFLGGWAEGFLNEMSQGRMYVLYL